MELKAYIEQAQRVFPNARQAEIIKAFDTAQKRFCKKSGILITENAELSDIDSNITWDLPTNFNELISIDYYDSDGYPLYNNRDIYLKAEVTNDYLYFISTSSTKLESRLPSTIDSVFINYFNKPSDLTNLNSGFSVDEEYRDFIRDGAYAELYLVTPVPLQSRDGNVVVGINVNLSSKHESLFKQGINTAISDRNKHKDDRSVEVVNYQFAGKFIEIKKQKPTAGSILTPSNILQKIYSKWVEFTITPTAVVEGSNTFGWDGTFSGVITSITDGDTITITSTESDFTSGVTQVTITNGDANWQFNSTTEFVITAWDSWSKITIELWERI